MAKSHPVMLDVILDEPSKAEPAKRKRSADEVVEDAHAAKRRATGDWVEGRISSEEHRAVHARANHVIKRKGII